MGLQGWVLHGTMDSERNGYEGFGLVHGVMDDKESCEKVAW